MQSWKHSFQIGTVFRNECGAGSWEKWSFVSCIACQLKGICIEWRETERQKCVATKVNMCHLSTFIFQGARRRHLFMRWQAPVWSMPLHKPAALEVSMSAPVTWVNREEQHRKGGNGAGVGKLLDLLLYWLSNYRS